MNLKDTCCIIINYRGLADTLACLESLRPALEQGLQLWVADNASGDGSVAGIKRWMEISGYSTQGENPQLNLIAHYLNAGFAGANNLAIKQALLRPEIQYFWLLNNDTVVDAGAGAALRNHLAAHPETGLAGSLLLDFAEPEKVQCSGALLLPWLGISKLVNKLVPEKEADLALPFDYQSGASIATTRKVIEQVGLMSTVFFLYFEETDWQMRMRRAGLNIDLVRASRVWHKGSVSTASAKEIYYYHYNKGSVLFMRRNQPGLQQAAAWLALLGITLVRTGGSLHLVKAGLKGLIDGTKAPTA